MKLTERLEGIRPPVQDRGVCGDSVLYWGGRLATRQVRGSLFQARESLRGPNSVVLGPIVRTGAFEFGLLLDAARAITHFSSGKAGQRRDILFFDDGSTLGAQLLNNLPTLQPAGDTIKDVFCIVDEMGRAGAEVFVRARFYQRPIQSIAQVMCESVQLIGQLLELGDMCFLDRSELVDGGTVRYILKRLSKKVRAKRRNALNRHWVGLTGLAHPRLSKRIGEPLRVGWKRPPCTVTALNG